MHPVLCRVPDVIQIWIIRSRGRRDFSVLLLTFSSFFRSTGKWAHQKYWNRKLKTNTAFRSGNSVGPQLWSRILSSYLLLNHTLLVFRTPLKSRNHPTADECMWAFPLLSVSADIYNDDSDHYVGCCLWPVSLHLIAQKNLRLLFRPIYDIFLNSELWYFHFLTNPGVQSPISGCSGTKEAQDVPWVNKCIESTWLF